MVRRSIVKTSALQLGPKAAISFLISTALIYRPPMNWLERRGDGREPDGPLEFTFPGLFWLPGFILPSKGIAPFTTAFLV